MDQFIQEAILGFNTPFSILLGVVLIYWIIAAIGLLDFEFLDGMLDVDSDVDASGSEGGDVSGNTFQNILRVFNATDVPIIFVISVGVVCLWVLNFIGNHYFNPTDSTFVAGVVVIPALIGSAILTRLLTEPLKPIARMMRTEEHQEPIEGKEGVVRSPELTADFGQVEVRTSGSPVLLNACLSHGEDDLPRGASVLVVARDELRKLWIVRPLDTMADEKTA